MSSGISRLTGKLKSFYEKLERQVDEATAEIEAGHGDSEQAVSAVVNHVKTIRKDLSELRALIGSETNLPPLDLTDEA